MSSLLADLKIEALPGCGYTAAGRLDSRARATGCSDGTGRRPAVHGAND